MSQTAGHRIRVFSMQEYLFVINSSRISRQSKAKGCETPKALSSSGYENDQTKKLSPL